MKRFISLAMALTIILCLASCNKMGSNSETTEVKVSEDFPATAEMVDFVNNEEDFFNSVNNNSDRYENDFKNNFGMSDEEIESIINTPEEWLARSMEIRVDNPNEGQLLIAGLEIAENGKNDVYIDANPDGGYQIFEGNGSETISVEVVLHNSDPSDEEFEALVREMSVVLLYCEYEDGVEEAVSQGTANILKAQVEM